MIIEPSVLDQIVNRLASAFHPDRIVLFGSQARGDTDGRSDIDLLVVVPIAGSSSRWPWIAVCGACRRPRTSYS